MSTKTKNLFFENLDAIRGIACGIVLIYHFFGYVVYEPANNTESFLISRFIKEGHLGVNLFFVLSGFLITYLLLVEKEDTGRINIPFFYMRRVLRIWPVYFLVVLIGLFVYPMLTHQFVITDVKDHLLYYLFFLNNFDRIFTDFTGIGNDSLGVLWSVAVEEQFYFFWPVLLFLFNKQKQVWLFIVIIIISLAYRWLNISDDAKLHFHTVGVMSDLAVGSLLAYACKYKTRIFYWIENSSRILISMMYVLMFLAILIFQQLGQTYLFVPVVERLILSFFFAFCIGEQCFAKNSFIKFGKTKLLNKVGVISYGIYSLHLFCIMVIQKLNIVLNITTLSRSVYAIEFILCLVLSYIVCYLSYHYFEKKILAWKKKFVVVATR